MQLDAAEKALIARSFRALAADAPAASASFYRHLFRILPGSENLFVTDIGRQGTKLAQTLQVIVDQLGRWGLLRTTLEDLAIRHLAYGVRAEHYDAVGEALLAMMAERLGPLYTPETARAWSRAYDGIKAVMVACAYPPGDVDDADG